MAQHLQTACEGTTASSNQPASTTQPTRSAPEVSASLPTQTTATGLGTSTRVPSQIPSPVITQSVVTTSNHHTSLVSSASARTPTQPTPSNSVMSTAGPCHTTAPASVASVSFTSTRIQNQPTYSVSTTKAVSFTCQPTVCVPAVSPSIPRSRN